MVLPVIQKNINFSFKKAPVGEAWQRSCLDKINYLNFLRLLEYFVPRKKIQSGFKFSCMATTSYCIYLKSAVHVQ